jgi:TonB family protein
MGANKIVPIANRPDAITGRPAAAPNKQERIFWLGVMFSAALHAGLIFHVGRALPRYMGEPEGSSDGISVELVEAADLMSRTTVPPRPEASSDGPSEATSSPQQAAASAAPSAPSVEEQKTTESKDLYVLPVPDPAGKQSKTESAKKNKSQPQQQSNLSPQLNLPDMQFAPQGRSAGFARPPGITRSGENDEFGRGVIRALRQTMPGARNSTGRVTIRFFLSEAGNLVEVQIVRSSGDSYLDQSVVFAAKQTSFPLPPSGSTVPDRTFLVTYVYL